LSLSKTKIIIRRDVERSSRSSGEGKGVVEVLGFTVKEIDGSSGNPSDRIGKTVIDTGLESPSVKGIKIRVEGCITLLGKCISK
jgi:hypothetical protein